MLLTADIGNTNIVLALLDHGDRVVSQRRIPSGEVLPLAAYEDAVRQVLEIAIEEPETLGVDLLAADAAAAAEYPLPVVVFDFGTATTVTVVDRQRRYRGGVILAGVKLSLHALFSGTAQLPDIALEPPGKVICSVTEDSLQAGAIYGAAAMADGLLERMEEELGQPCTAVATGGLSGIITPYCRRRILHDDSLLLRGLALIWRKNCGNR